MSEKYLYIFSKGEYSDYHLKYLLIHEKKFTEEELKEMAKEFRTLMKREYAEELEENYCPPKEIDKEFSRFIRDKGFEIVYLSGEFNSSYSNLKDFEAYIPWYVKDKESSLFRLGY